MEYYVFCGWEPGKLFIESKHATLKEAAQRAKELKKQAESSGTKQITGTRGYKAG